MQASDAGIRAEMQAVRAELQAVRESLDTRLDKIEVGQAQMRGELDVLRGVEVAVGSSDAP